NLGDEPITGIAYDTNGGDLYVSTDFGVDVLKAGGSQWVPAGGGLPPVTTYGLTLDSNARLLYAATHGRGAWSLPLQLGLALRVLKVALRRNRAATPPLALEFSISGWIGAAIAGAHHLPTPALAPPLLG